MKNLPIKFRGKRVDNGRLAFGYYVPWSVESRNGMFSLKEKVAGYAGILTDGGELVAVNADTVKQLVGWDSAGVELYEGDELFHDYWYRCGSQRANVVKRSGLYEAYLQPCVCPCHGVRTFDKYVDHYVSWHIWEDYLAGLVKRKSLLERTRLNGKDMPEVRQDI